MAKYNQKLVAEIEAWISEYGLMDYGGKKMKDFLAAFHIDYNSYKKWKQIHPEFEDAIERAKLAFKNNLSRDLAITLADVAKGYTRDEEDEYVEYRPSTQKTDDGKPAPPKIVKMTKSKRKKYFKPDVGAAIFLLTNLDPEHYQNRQRSDLTIKKSDDKELTLNEINDEIARLEKLDEKDE